MIWAVFKTMLLRLIRDRGAIALAFILPGFIYAIFAAIFANASGGQLDIRAAMAVQTDAPNALRLASAVQEGAEFSLLYDESWTAENVKEQTALGTVDVGFVLTGDLTAPDAILILTEPSREIAATVLQGELRRLIAGALPDVILSQNVASVEQIAGGLSAAQSAQIDAAIAQVRSEGHEAGERLFATQSAIDGASSPSVKDASVIYYIGATAILFLLFSAMQGAALSVEERGTGITDRLLLGRRGAMAMLTGKFLFLTAQGFLQAVVILLVAKTFFAVPIFDYIPALFLVCLVTAGAAAGLALLTATLCKTGVQIHTVSTFLVLLFSAIGGSMVPRFMMPDWLQSLGQFTPNMWAIEGFYGVLARGLAASQIAMPLFILGSIGIISLLLASVLSHRLMRF